MDARAFDRLTQTLGIASTRRAALGALLGAAETALLRLERTSAAARNPCDDPRFEPCPFG